MQRIVARLAPAGIVCGALAACTDVGDSLAPGTGTGDDATSGQTGGATYAAAPDSNDPRADTGTDGTVATPSDASVADTGMMSALDTGSRNDSGSTQGADTGVAGSSDTGAPDTGAPDTGTPDMGQPDTGIVVDTGAPDTGGADAGLDASAADTGSDSGGTDTGANDSGATDADAALADGASDGSVVDTGTTADSGSPDPCSPNNPNATAAMCLNSVSAACLACAQANGCLDPATGGANCELSALTTTNATLFPSTLPDGKTCSQVVAPASVPVTERAICFEVVQTVIVSLCGASTQLTPCLCGATDPAVCLTGTATPTGAAFDLYACDFNSTNGSTINSQFPMLAFGAGAANALLACVGAFGCHCLGD